ncbi:MAG: hypothetical protein KKC46_15710 [Proteobacteria bacterium]|nr:hypothetical protein [Pseudomonadota bacterium]
MIKTKDIKAVELGPRQLMFGFEDHTEGRQDLIVEGIKTMLEAQGQLSIEHFVEHMEQAGWTCSDILQHVFWAALELKIHFLWNNRMLSPFEAKLHLLQSPKNAVELITNKKVRPSVFQEAASIYRTISNDDNQEYGNDQYQLALSLFSVLHHWEKLLIFFAGKAQKPFYPGKELVSKHQQSLNLLLSKKDSYSLLSNCCNHSDTLFEIAQDIKMLSVFYSEHVFFWENLIQSMGDFDESLAEIRNFPEILHAHEQLNQILTSAFPYDRINKAKLLLSKVRELNDRILKEKINNFRRTASYRINTMIDHLSGLLEQLNTKPDKRNRILYPLHMQKKRLGVMNSMQEIDDLLNQTLEQADDFITELENDCYTEINIRKQ